MTINSSNKTHLRQLGYLRFIALATQAITVIAVTFGFSIELPLMPLSLIIGGGFLLAVGTQLSLKKLRSVSNPALCLHLLLDTAELVAMLYFTGGSTNPFASLFLLQVIIAASTLPALYSWLVAGVTICAYSFLLFSYLPIQYSAHHNLGYFFNLHIHGMWLGFVVSSMLVAYFVVKMSNTLRMRDRMLAEAREKLLRDEQVTALGTMAIGTAHELGTPLASMTIITQELLNDYRGNAELIEPLTVLRQELDRSKGIIHAISAAAGVHQAGGGKREAVDIYVRRVLAEWRGVRGVAVSLLIDSGSHVPEIITDTVLSQAIVNILNNAADSCPENITVALYWSDQQATLSISDGGKGLPQEVKAQLGKPFTTTKPEGQGLGIFLAVTVIERMGGTIEFMEEDKGVCVCITLPVYKEIA